MYEIRTDLALEAREKFEEDNVEIKGVVLEEKRAGNADLKSRDRDRKRGKKHGKTKRNVCHVRGAEYDGGG